MRHAHAIATRAAALAIIAGTGFTPLTPITAHADTTSTQPAASTNGESKYGAKFIIDKTRVFEYDGTHKTITCLSADYPKEVEAFQSSVGTNIGASIHTKVTASDTTTTIDGRTIKGKTYTVPLGPDDKFTLNCYKAGDFFANLKITWNGIQATDFNPYGPDGVNDAPADQYPYSSGTATINTSMTSDEIKKLDDTHPDHGIHIEGIPTGWIAKSDFANGNKNNAGPGYSITKGNGDAFTETTTYEYTNPEYPGNTYKLAITQINTAPQPTIQATNTPAPADTQQLVQTGVEQVGAATALLATTAIAAHTIARRKRK